MSSKLGGPSRGARALLLIASFAMLALAPVVAQAASISLVTVGNAGNTADGTGYGAVATNYAIGVYEVTAGQYAEFLNAVAKTADPYNLYNSLMWNDAQGCKIQQTFANGIYTYSVASDWANRPVNYVSWADAARFVNWLANGQPVGAQGLSTTESGSYYLNGATTSSALAAVTRSVNAVYTLPTENEWYKAAYHLNDGATNHYYDYPTRNDAMPSNNVVSPDPGNNANFQQTLGDLSIGAPYYRTIGGQFANSESPYGTYDQGGNVAEWTESGVTSSVNRVLRGGSYLDSDTLMLSSYRIAASPLVEDAAIGFRVAAVPEPGTLALALAALAGAAVWRRRRR